MSTTSPPAATPVGGTGLPRELGEGIWWIGSCLESAAFDEPVHFHTSAYLVLGADKTLLFDTGPSGAWEKVSADLTEVLQGRPLDYVVPSHPEIPHAGSLDRVLTRFPEAQVLGDLRDFHLYFPEFADRMTHVPHGTEIDLGGGFVFVVLEAIIKDLPSTVWGYEKKRRVLFPVDALGYGHLPQPSEHVDEPLHRRGECALLASELSHPPDLDLATHLTKSSLFWSRFVHIEPYFERFDALLEQYPTDLLAPAHGSVVDDLDVIIPVLKLAHRKAFVG